MSEASSTRKTGEAIRHDIGRAARALSCQRGLDEQVSKFVGPFTKLEDTSRKNLLPNALTAAMDAAFSGTDLKVWKEAKFEVHGGNRVNSDITKSVDFVVTSRAGHDDCRAVALEVKATMEFNSLAAALMEFAMLTERTPVTFRDGSGKQFEVSTGQLLCMTLSCYDNQVVSWLLPLMERQLWPDGRRTIKHHGLFAKAVTLNQDSTLGIAEFLADIQRWCKPEESKR